MNKIEYKSPKLGHKEKKGEGRRKTEKEKKNRTTRIRKTSADSFRTANLPAPITFFPFLNLIERRRRTEHATQAHRPPQHKRSAHHHTRTQFYN